MDQAPADTELRNIIDKLAQFVARNGPEFEQMTKNKQKDNPKFSFLFRGEYFNYYQYKVTTEQAILKQKGINPMQNADPRLNVSQQQQQSAVAAVNNVGMHQNNGLNSVQANMGPAGNPPNMHGSGPPHAGPGHHAGPPNAGPGHIPPVHNAGHMPVQQNSIGRSNSWLQNELSNLQSQQTTLQDQVRQSEQNLAAQHAALMAQQQGRVEDAVRQAQENTLQTSAQNTNTDLATFDSVLQPIIDSCTKDSISAGKAWILQHSITLESNQVIAEHLLKRVIQETTFTHKLHIIYLVNDVLHHCARKKSVDLRKAMESVVVPMFCNTSLVATEEQLNKLNKLLSLWESKSNYFEEGIIEKLKDPSGSWSDYQTSLMTQHAGAITSITATTKQTFDNYQAQHQAFVNHAMRQIQNIEQQKISIDRQLKAPPSAPMQPNQQNVPPHSGPPISGPPPVAHSCAPPPRSNRSHDVPPRDVVPPHEGPPSYEGPPPYDGPPPYGVPHAPHAPHSRDHPSMGSHGVPPHSGMPPHHYHGGPPPYGVPHGQHSRDHPSMGSHGPPHSDHPSMGSHGPPHSDHPSMGSHGPPHSDHPSMGSHGVPPHSGMPPHHHHPGPLHASPPHGGMHPDYPPDYPPHRGPPLSSPHYGPPHGGPPHGMPPHHHGGPPPHDLNFSQPPPNWNHPSGPPPNLPLPDFSKPPPGFGPPTGAPPPPLMAQEVHIQPEDLMPSMPYFELPAGLMVPLIKLEDYNYKPLDADAIRLPPPAPPSDRLIAAVEAFYAPPNHDSPRDSDGWEKLGLYEYYRAKNTAKKRKEDDIKSGVRQKSKSPSPILRPRSKSPSPPKKRYRSKSKSRSRSRSPRERARSRSRSPVPTTPNHNSRRNSRNSHSNSRNRRRRNSGKSSESQGSGTSHRSPDRRVDRSDRSPTPPSFLGSTYSKTAPDSSIDESNKGHQLLRKMGWGGAGLGANEQGIEAPISGGEIRDRVDQYKGVGINLNDPYENFRKSKGQAFITRMKARAEERAEERGGD